jgi:cysteine desulfurase family protein
MIYLDNSATSWPKPPEVKKAMVKFLEEVGANPGRSGHLLSIEAARILYEAREALATLFNVKDPLRIIFTLNATESINLALKGLLKSGDHVITSSLEHNSVMRPLRTLERTGVELSVISSSEKGFLDPAAVKKKIKTHTRMIVLNHASNVIGTLLPVQEVGTIARDHDLIFLVDAAQTAGSYPIDVEESKIDLLAFTGHKSLYGPQGTGGLVIGNRINEKEFTPLKQGGTGSRSEFEEQPEFLPDRFESGTPNGVGIAGLLAGVQFVSKRGIQSIRRHEMALYEKLAEGLKDISRITLYGSQNRNERIATLSFTMAGLPPSEAAIRLERKFKVLCRPGLHCAPSAHRTIGTFPEGTVRLSIGAFNTEEDIRKAIDAVAQISASSA